MIFKIYEYDYYDHAVGQPSSKLDLRSYLNDKKLPELIQVDSYEVREYEDYHPLKEPKAIIKNNLPDLVWETSADQQKAYDQWCLTGKDHQWYGSQFSRTIEKPVYGYDIQTMEQLEVVLEKFEIIIWNVDSAVICH